MTPEDAFTAAYMAKEQDKEVLLRGRVSEVVIPAEIIKGDLLWDGLWYRQVKWVEHSFDKTKIYVFFTWGTRGASCQALSAEFFVRIWRGLMAGSDGVD